MRNKGIIEIYGIPHSRTIDKVKKAFPSLLGKTRVVLNNAEIPADLREKLWAECGSTSTKLICIVQLNGNSHNEMFYGRPNKLGRSIKILVK
jgi:hypothetical protein